MTRVVETPQSHCRAGISTGDITPPVGIYHRMWGAALHDRAEGIHRPLTATALLLAPLEPPEAEPSPAAADGLAEPQLIIAVDHCILSDEEAARIGACIERRTDIPARSIVLCFSHTHAAGLMLRDRAHLPGGDRIGPYLDALAERLADLAAQAREQLRQAVIVYGQANCELARRRDYWDAASGQFVCGFDPDGGGDATVIVARITDTAGALMATIVNYACHPTTLAWENRHISPDFPGALRELVQQATGAPCLFLQGASGDLGPREGFSGELELADRNGRQLGYAALSAFESLPPPVSRYVYQGPVISGATLGIWRHEPIREPNRLAELRAWHAEPLTIPLCYRDELPTLSAARAALEQWREREQEALASGDELEVRDCRAMVERQTRQVARLEMLPEGDTFPLRAWVLRIGDAVWIAVQGEPYSELQTELRRRFPDRVLVVIALAFGWGPSYLPPAGSYGKGIYQETIAILAPGSLEQVIEAIAAAIESLAGASSP